MHYLMLPEACLTKSCILFERVDLVLFLNDLQNSKAISTILQLNYNQSELI